MTGFRLELSLTWVGITFVAMIGAIVASLCGAAVTTFTLTYAAIAGLPLCMARNSRNADFFRPYFGLIVLTYLYSVSTILYVAEFDVTYYNEAVSPDDLQVYQTACLLTAAGLAAGLISSTILGQRRCFAQSYGQVHTKVLLRTAMLLGLICAPLIAPKFMPWMATSYVDMALSLRVDRMQDQAAGLKEVFFISIPSTLVLCACTQVLFDQKHSTKLRLVCCLLLLTYLLTAALSGWRSQIVMTLVIFTVYLHYRIRKLRPSMMIAGAIFIYLLINLLSVARVSSNPTEMVLAILSDVSDRGLQFLALQHSGELATSTNLLRLIQGLRERETNHGFGFIALGQIIAFVPRALLPDRPDVASELFVKTFYPEVFEVGGGYGFFIPQDGYWDFGLIGVFVYAFIFSMIVETGYSWIRRRIQSDVYVFFYALLYSQLVVAVVRSGFVGSIKAALIASMPVLLVFFLIKFWSKKTKI